MPETPVRIVPNKLILDAPFSQIAGAASTSLEDQNTNATKAMRITSITACSCPLMILVENTPWKNTQQGRFLARMGIREVFAQNLKALRRARGMSQEELAHRAEIDRTYVSSLERCVYGASIDVLARLADVLGVEPADLLRRSLPLPKTKTTV